jgi:hypothetical protein
MRNMIRSKLAKHVGLGAVGVALLALMPTSSFAAPLGGVSGVQAPSSVVTQADYRCWWSDGERQCAWFGDDAGPRVYGYYYGPFPEVADDYYSHPRRPESFRTGSQRWWNSMERWGRTGGGTP